jgi:hypothetical protein
MEIAPAEKLAQLAAANRARQKKYYDLNRVKIIERKRKEYEDKKKAAEPVAAAEPAPVAAPPPKKTTKPRPVKSVLKSAKLTMKGLVKDLTATSASEGSKSFYEDYAKRLLLLLELTENEPLSPILNDYKKVFKAIDDSDFALNTKKSLYQFIVYMSDRTLLKLNKAAKEAYKLKFAVYKEDSIAQNAEKIEAEPTFPLHIAMLKITNRFGANSKIGLIARLYSEFTPRDDFQLKIVNDKKNATDKETNYVIVGEDFMTIVLHDYKTSKSNGTIIYPVSADLVGDLLDYIKDKGLGEGDYLFGDKKLSKFISENLGKAGITGGINTFRHMVISKLLEDDKTTTEDRVKKAKLMGHSPLVQMRYLRKHEKTD